MVTELHVVFGSGALGKAVVRELLIRHKQVRLVNRTGNACGFPTIEAVACDARRVEETRRVCQGASVVYSCINAPYTDWPALFPPLQEGILFGAAASNAKLVVAENLYMYGPVTTPLREDLPYLATARKGRVRAQMSEALFTAHRQGIVRATAGRASDFYGPDTAQQGVFGERIMKPLLAGKKVAMPGNLDQPHSYTYIHDFAKGLVILGEREEALGQPWHIPNAPASTTRQVLTLLFAEAGLPARIETIPTSVIKLLGFLNPVVHELEEMLYEFDEPFVVDDSMFIRAFGNIATPLREGMRETVAWFRLHQNSRTSRLHEKQNRSPERVPHHVF